MPEIIEASTHQHRAIAKEINLRTAANCGSCAQRGGWEDNAYCRKHGIEVRAKEVCDDYDGEPNQ